MIVTCPNCTSKFTLDSYILGEKGSKVRCSSCEDVWFQESEYRPFAKPDEENRDIEIAQNLNPISRNIGKSKAMGYGTAAACFFIVMIYLLSNSTSIMRDHPSAQAFYAMFGIEMKIPGQGLIFDKIAVNDYGDTVTISGNIVNLKIDESVVPIIEVSLRAADDSVINQWYIEPSKNILAAAESLSFESVYHKQSDREGKNLHVRFVLAEVSVDDVSKTDAASDENNPVPHQGDSDHQSDHAESSKSHQPDSYEHHQESGH